MSDQAQPTVSEIISSTNEEKKPETTTIPSTTETTEVKTEVPPVEQKNESEPKKEEQSKIKLEATQENKDKSKLKYFLKKNIVIKKIEETFVNMDKYEQISNDLDKQLWELVKFPLANNQEESKFF